MVHGGAGQYRGFHHEVTALNPAKQVEGRLESTNHYLYRLCQPRSYRDPKTELTRLFSTDVLCSHSDPGTSYAYTQELNQD